MIALVSGTVAVRRADHVVIECGGVGYRLAVSSETLKSVPAAGSDTFLHAELIAREDSLALYGFASEDERDFSRRTWAASAFRFSQCSPIRRLATVPPRSVSSSSGHALTAYAPPTAPSAS